MSHLSPRPLLVSKTRRPLAAAAAVAAVLVAGLGWHFLHSAPPAEAPAAPDSLATIVARGRIEPEGRVLVIHGPAEGAVVAELRVDQGDVVTPGQVLATLEGYGIRKAELLMAERALALAELQWKQTVAGAKRSDIAAQRNLLAAKEARLDKLEKEWSRRTALHSQGFVSAQALDTVNAERGEAVNEVAQAANVLKSLTETRSIDEQVAIAKADVERAAVERARAQLEHLVIRAPKAGTVLSIQARTGELVGQDGLLRMAALDRIMVVAEVDEGMAARLREGMAATIEARMLDKPVDGRVTRLGHEVFREKRPASDVLVGRDAKIVEVDVTPDGKLPAILGAEVLVRLLDGAAGKP